MGQHDIIKDIVFLPEKLHANGNISAYAFLKKIGYFELHDRVGESKIFEMLIRYPERINQWLRWSEDKRSSSGWYFRQNNERKYIVGHFSVKGDQEITEYSEIAEACAAFIKKEIESIRNH